MKEEDETRIQTIEKEELVIDEIFQAVDTEQGITLRRIHKQMVWDLRAMFAATAATVLVVGWLSAMFIYIYRY